MDNSTNPIIGKDVIESLTMGMYEDCRFIFREYIQNSADQIDKAVNQNLISKAEEGIFISIFPEKKLIEIEDNATGISSLNVIPILQNIAQSTKERGKDKGFRGIGRLGGLGYCKKLVFETSFFGEEVKSIMTWDAQLLKEIINNRHYKESASDVIKKVTTLSTQPEDSSKHYFKVILEDVTNDKLLNVKSIEDYLSMVAPIPYHPGFIFKSKIKEYIEQLNTSIDEYKIYLNGDLLFKAYTTSLYYEINGSKRKIENDEIFDLQFFKEINKDGQLLYWGWYSVSNFTKQLDNCNLARGIRLRKNNIQVGADYTLVNLFKEQRGNYYFFGEVHGTHPDLLPNSRRDYFSENSTCHLFEAKLKEFFYNNLHKLYYDASKIRSANKEIQSFVELTKTVKEQENIGFTNHEQKETLYKELESKKKKAEEAKKKLESIKQKVEEQPTPVAKIFERVVNTEHIKPSEIEIQANDKKTTFVTDKYSWLPKSERKLLSRVFGVIENVLSKEMSKNLIDKIDEELRK